MNVLIFVYECHDCFKKLCHGRTYNDKQIAEIFLLYKYFYFELERKMIFLCFQTFERHCWTPRLHEWLHLSAKWAKKRLERKLVRMLSKKKKSCDKCDQLKCFQHQQQVYSTNRWLQQIRKRKFGGPKRLSQWVSHYSTSLRPATENCTNTFRYPLQQLYTDGFQMQKKKVRWFLYNMYPVVFWIEIIHEKDVCKVRDSIYHSICMYLFSPYYRDT